MFPHSLYTYGPPIGQSNYISTQQLLINVNHITLPAIEYCKPIRHRPTTRAPRVDYNTPKGPYSPSWNTPGAVKKITYRSPVIPYQRTIFRKHRTAYMSIKISSHLYFFFTSIFTQNIDTDTRIFLTRIPT